MLSLAVSVNVASFSVSCQLNGHCDIMILYLEDKSHHIYVRTYIQIQYKLTN